MKKISRKDRSRPSKSWRNSAEAHHAPGQRHGSSTGEERPRPHFTREVAVLYEDDALIVLDKPPGLLSVPIKGADVPSALSVLVEELAAKRQRPLVVHRIDRFASGILLFAKTNAVRESLVAQFLEHTPVREYLTVIRGHLDRESDTLVHYFRREGMFQQLRTANDPGATRAELHYSVESTFEDASLLRVELITGLQNQIRAQLAAIGHPVIGDRKYKHSEASEELIDRVALHAAHLEFVHPKTGETVSIDCRPPADFQQLVRELGRTRRSRR